MIYNKSIHYGIIDTTLEEGITLLLILSGIKKYIINLTMNNNYI